MFAVYQKTTIMLVMTIYTATAAGLARGAEESFELFLCENESAKVRYQNCSPEQRLEMKQRWAIFNERYNSLTLSEQKKINAMRREREARWSRLSEYEKAELLDSGKPDLEPCIAEYPFQECNI